MFDRVELSGRWTEIELDPAILEDKLQIFSFVAARYFFSPNVSL